MFSALKHINCDLKMQFLCNLTSIIRKLNLRTKSPKFISKFTTIFYSVRYLCPTKNSSFQKLLMTSMHVI